MLLKVGELAKRTGLTVRTLHHYDEIGLLRPTGRSEGNYRLYGADDVARLHAIQTLRGLGLALDEIGRLLGGAGADLQAMVARQIEALEARIREAGGLRERLRLVQSKFDAGTPPSLDDWLRMLSMMTASARHFNTDEIREIFADWETVEVDWQRLAADVRAVMAAGVPAQAPEVQPLAHRWMALMHDWMGGDFDRMERWGRMFHAELGAQGRSGVDREMVLYIEQAVQLRLSLLLKHIDDSELRRIRGVPQREWHALAEEARALMATDAAVDGPAARALAARRLDMLTRMAGGDAALRDRIQRAYAAEPLLQLGGSLPADVRDYLLRVPVEGA